MAYVVQLYLWQCTTDGNTATYKDIENIYTNLKKATIDEKSRAMTMLQHEVPVTRVTTELQSQLHGISRGIPQGSVMGLLLFNIVINDLSVATKKFDLIMYADNTTLISTLETFGNTNRPTEIENNISNEISKIAT